jgi:hypothetical protein
LYIKIKKIVIVCNIINVKPSDTSVVHAAAIMPNLGINIKFNMILVVADTVSAIK